jgi:ribose transport system ATP-binding protein
MIRIDHVSKSFPGVVALNDISFQIDSGTVHGLVGENGAGKSTLIKIISGIYTDYEGDIFIDDQQLQINSVHESQKKGIATIFQELTVVRELTVAENIFLGREPVGFAGALDRAEMERKSQQVLNELNVSFSPRDKVGDLSVANQQIVEISKALVLNTQILIMDEPTSSLTEKEVQNLFSVIHTLKSKGITILYVSHKLEEIFEICDAITVLRDGKHIHTSAKSETNPPDVIRMMVGRSLNMLFPPRTAKKGDLLLSVKDLTREGEFKDINFEVHAGEIVGFAGLIGSGRTELAKALFGATCPDQGEIKICNQKMKLFCHPREAITQGLVYLSEDRKQEGLILLLSVRENISLPIIKKISQNLFVKRKEEQNIVDSLIEKLKIKVFSRDQVVETLSGGNQQKVVISKLLLTNAQVFIFDEPTRGIDVGAKYEIYKIMNDLTADGKGIVFISSELPEIIGISDRIYCMREGSIVKEYTREKANPENVMSALTGGSSI